MRRQLRHISIIRFGTKMFVLTLMGSVLCSLSYADFELPTLESDDSSSSQDSSPLEEFNQPTNPLPTRPSPTGISEALKFGLNVFNSLASVAPDTGASDQEFQTVLNERLNSETKLGQLRLFMDEAITKGYEPNPIDYLDKWGSRGKEIASRIKAIASRLDNNDQYNYNLLAAFFDYENATPEEKAEIQSFVERDEDERRNGLRRPKNPNEDFNPEDLDGDGIPDSQQNPNQGNGLCDPIQVPVFAGSAGELGSTPRFRTVSAQSKEHPNYEQCSAQGLLDSLKDAQGGGGSGGGSPSGGGGQGGGGNHGQSEGAKQAQRQIDQQSEALNNAVAQSGEALKALQNQALENPYQSNITQPTLPKFSPSDLSALNANAQNQLNRSQSNFNNLNYRQLGNGIRGRYRDANGVIRTPSGSPDSFAGMVQNGSGLSDQIRGYSGRLSQDPRAALFNSFAINQNAGMAPRTDVGLGIRKPTTRSNPTARTLSGHNKEKNKKLRRNQSRRIR